MQVALMIPCYIDVFYPEVGIATMELLEKLKVDVVYPFDQTCCGQPMANSGCFEESRATEELFLRNFSDRAFRLGRYWGNHGPSCPGGDDPDRHFLAAHKSWRTPTISINFLLTLPNEGAPLAARWCDGDHCAHLP